MTEPTTVTPTANVVVGYLHPGDVAHSFHISWDRMRTYDQHHGRHIHSMIAEECGAGRITEGRNHVVRKFLATPAEWLLFIDSDMGFDPDSVERMLEHANPDTVPILGGLAFAQRKGPERGLGARWFDHVPTVYRWVELPHVAGAVPIANYPKDSLVKVDATGAAFLMIHRTALEGMRGPEPLPWFADTIYKGTIFGEDITFCRRAIEAGYPVHVHTGIQTSHAKLAYIDEATARTNLEAPTFVIIPTLDKVELLRPLVEELHRQGGHDAIFIMDNGSGEETLDWLKSQTMAEVYDATGANYHEMMNYGLDLAIGRAWPFNALILNNDIEIGPDFVTGLATALRENPQLGAVSPNYDGREGSGLQLVNDICGSRYDGTGGLAGFAVMFRGESGYRFPTELQWWFGDNHLLANVLLGGSAAAIDLDTTCVHVDGGSQTGGDWSDKAEEIEADRQWFENWVASVTARVNGDEEEE